jgi:hypothetical protein
MILSVTHHRQNPSDSTIDNVVQKTITLIIHSDSLSPAKFIRICVQELALSEPSVHIGNSCSHLCEGYGEHFQLIFLLPVISPGYYSAGHVT